MKSTHGLFPLLFAGWILPAQVRVLPTPQYLEPVAYSVPLTAGAPVIITTGPSVASNPKMQLAADFLAVELREQPSRPRVSVRSSSGTTGTMINIHLWDYSADQNLPVRLNLLDRQTLVDRNHFGQSYVLRMPDRKTVWVIGSSAQGVLLGCMTLLQLVRSGARRGEIAGAYIRDYPDFEFRAADWLLNVEINRWDYDRGHGPERLLEICKRRIDQALRLKLNMVLIDGFGWGLDQRFPGYAPLMRTLNGYARERGVSLIYGGYGASYGIAYQSGPLYEEGAYLGKIFENRESYPDGKLYRCMGFPRSRKGRDPSELGSCRSNEDLNKLKADELRAFVEAVQPGALYIHHEDFGGIRGTAKVWRDRCQRCKARWPNDELTARDGGAGGLANGYAALIRAVRSVRDASSGYDASRDCQIILVSPVYVPDSPDSEVWADVLELWKNIGLELPKAENVQVCFREVFPQEHGTAKWTRELNQVMRSVGLNLGSFLFFAGGADNFITDYPLSGAPSMNALFRGARSMYNASGDFYQQPMEVINAEYSWNTRSTGFVHDPRSHSEAVNLRRRYVQPGEPAEIFGKDGIYEAACDLLYGKGAGSIMAAYYKESAWLPDSDAKTSDPTGRNQSWLPMTWDRAFAVPSHWRHLALDAKTWGADITNEVYLREMTRLKIDRPELHRRLARRWSLVAQLNSKGAEYIAKALSASPLPRAVEDLRFLETSFRVYQPFTEALAEYHRGLQVHFLKRERTSDPREFFTRALQKATLAEKLAREAFPNPLDPVGGEVGSARRYSQELVNAIGAMSKRPGTFKASAQR